MWLFGCASVRTITRTLQELIREEHGVSVKFISKGKGGGGWVLSEIVQPQIQNDLFQAFSL